MNTKINYVLPIVSFIYAVLFFIFYFFPHFNLSIFHPISHSLEIKPTLIYLTILASFIFLITSIKKRFFVQGISFFSLFLYFLSFWVIMNTTFAYFDFHSGGWFRGMGAIIIGVASGIILFLLFIVSFISTKKTENLKLQKFITFLIYLFGILFMTGYTIGAFEPTNFLYKIEQIKNPTTVDDVMLGDNIKITDQNIQATTASFGALNTDFVDNSFGLSFKFPKELILEMLDKSCAFRLGTKYPQEFELRLYNPNCKEKSGDFNPNAKSLDDYKKNYLISKEQTLYGETNTWIKLLSSNEITTSTGTKGLRQKYQYLFINPKTGEEYGKFDTKETFLRYVFYNPEKGFYMIFSVHDLLKFLELESKIIDTLNY